MDVHWMRVALGLAKRGLGQVWPNPAVGCVLVREGLVVGRGWTQPGGRPHAEAEALARAGGAARGATAYVSLEPCAHHGQTPPCSSALAEAGIVRCVVALRDPDPRVSGRGVARLEKAGIAVETGLFADEAARVNAGYLERMRSGRPMVTWKVASSLDGRIASGSGHSRWITGELAREHAHLLRACHDAVMIGSRTAMVDRPRLTCRLPGLTDRSPLRVIADSRLELPLTDPLANTHQARTCILTLPGAGGARRKAYASRGIEIIDVAPGRDGRLDMGAALGELGARGMTRVMVEGGGRLAGTLLAADLVDRIEWFRAARILGDDGAPAARAPGLDRIEDSPGFERIATLSLADDVLESYVRLT